MYPNLGSLANCAADGVMLVLAYHLLDTIVDCYLESLSHHVMILVIVLIVMLDSYEYHCHYYYCNGLVIAVDTIADWNWALVADD